MFIALPDICYRMSDSGRPAKRGEAQRVPESWKDIVFHPQFDELLDCLSHHRRRLVLFLLKEDAVDTDSDILSWIEKQPERTMLALRHRHLPKLESAGLIDWNQRTGRLSKGSRFDEVVIFFEFFESCLSRFENNHC